jgi:hypothetical protein
VALTTNTEEARDENAPRKIINESTICKTNTIPILMHQMRISTNKVSSVMLRPKEFDIGKKEWKNCESRKNPSAMKLSQIRRRIELSMREIILCFEMNL